MKKNRFRALKLACVVALAWFCRAFFPYPLWIPVWAALAYVIAFRVELDMGRPGPGPHGGNSDPLPGEARDKPHWGKFK